MTPGTPRTIYRIGTNYVRLFLTLVLGIALVPIQFLWLGDKAFGVLTLVGASVGLAAMMDDLTRQSLIRELASAFHSGRENFVRAYRSAYLISGTCALVTVAAFALLALLMGGIPEQDSAYITSARWLICFEGLFIVLRVLMAPAVNLFLVREQFALHNAMLVAHRSSLLVSTLVLFLGFGIEDPHRGLFLFGALNASINILVLATVLAVICFEDPALVPSPFGIDSATAKSQLSTFGWNSGVILALNLHERVPQFIVAVVFGLEATAAYGVAFRLASYIRMFAMGVTGGLDSVAARVRASGEASSLVRLVRQSTRLHAIAVFPCAFGVFLLADPLIGLWIGRQVTNPASVVPAAIMLTQVIMIATSSRAISDAWLRILYGAGYVRSYAPTVLFGGVLNPIVASALLLLLPEQFALIAPAIAFAGVFSFFHMLLIPMIGARTLSVRTREMFTPLVRPALVFFAPTVALGLAVSQVDTWTLPSFLAIGGAYGLLTGIAAFFFAFSPEERRRLLSVARSGRMLVARFLSNRKA